MVVAHAAKPNALGVPPLATATVHARAPIARARARAALRRERPLHNHADGQPVLRRLR